MAELSPQGAEQSGRTPPRNPAASTGDNPDQALPADNNQRPPGSDESVLNLVSIGGEALFNAAVREPARGFAQLLNRLPGVNLPVPEQHQLTKTTSTLDWTVQQLGTGIGMIAPFKLASAVRPLLIGEDLVGSSRAFADGAFFGATLTPSDDPNRNFWGQRAISGIVGGVAFGTQHAVAQWGMSRLGLSDTTMLANPWPTIAGRLTVNAAAGGIAGFSSVETNSLLTTRHVASAAEVKQSVASFMVMGFGLDAIHVAGEQWAGRRPAGAARPLFTDDTSVGATPPKPLAADELQAPKPSGDPTFVSPDAIPGKYFEGILAGLRGGADTALSGMRAAFSFGAGTLEARMVGRRGPLATDTAGTVFAPDPNLTAADMQPRTARDQNVVPAGKRPVAAPERADIKVRSDQLRGALDESLRAVSPAVEGAHRADFDRLMQELERRASSTDQGEVAATYGAVTDLLSADKLQVPLSSLQRLTLAKQILAQAAEPNSIRQGQNITCGPMAVEQMALYSSPGKQARAIVDVLTKGTFTTKSDQPSVVDLSRSLFERIDRANGLSNVYTRTLAPDVQARASLEAAAPPGAPLAYADMRSYASQLAQLINANIKWQTLVPENERAVYAMTTRDPLLADSGERRLALTGDRALQPIMYDGYDGPQGQPEPVVGPGIESRDLQPIYDALTGKDSAPNNFVLLNTEGPLTSAQGTRFTTPSELENLLSAGQHPFVVEIDPEHPLFRIGDATPDDLLPTRHVVTVEPALHPETGESLLRGDRLLFNVTDGLGRARGYTGENGLTADELYQASLHPFQSSLSDVPVALLRRVPRDFGQMAREIGAPARTASPISTNDRTNDRARTGSPASWNDLSFEDRWRTLESTQPRVQAELARGTTKQNLMYRQMRSSLLRMGLVAEGWDIFSTEQHSPADQAGFDFFLANKHTGELHLIDITRTSSEDRLSAKRDRAGIETIGFRGTDFDEGGNVKANSDLSKELDMQLRALTDEAALFDLRYTPIPDFRAQDQATIRAQVAEFVTWLKERSAAEKEADRAEDKARKYGPDMGNIPRSDPYSDLAAQLEKTVLRFFETARTGTTVGAFNKRLQNAATNAVLDMVLADMVQQRGKSLSLTSLEDKLDRDRFDITASKNQDGPRSDPSFQMIFHTTDGRAVRSEPLGDVLRNARIALRSTPSYPLETAKKRLEQNPGSVTAQDNVSAAQLDAKIQKRLANIEKTLRIKIDRDQLNSHLDQAAAVIDRGGAQQVSPKNPILRRMQQYLQSQTEASLLAENSEPTPKKEVDPFSAVLPAEDLIVNELRALSITPDTPKDEVELALSLVLETPDLPVGVSDALRQMIDSYASQTAASKNAETRIADWLARAAEPQP